MRTLHRPTTLAEAAQLMASLEDTMVYGGGTAIQILNKQGILFTEDFVDLAGVPALGRVEVTEDGVTVGPMVSLRQMERTPAIRSAVPLASVTYGHVANPRVRNTASVGGNVAHGDYRLDPPTALMVLDATFTLTSVRGDRKVRARDFFIDFQQTAVARDEIISALHIPRQPISAGSCFVKLSSLSGNDWPSASAAALVTGRGATTEVRLALGALAPMTQFTEFPASGMTADDAVDAALDLARPLMDPLPDVRGSAEYKRRLGVVAVEEAVRGAWKELVDA